VRQRGRVTEEKGSGKATVKRAGNVDDQPIDIDR
jgi:hypothetical protein